MTRSPLDRQAGLPRSIPLFDYTPQRNCFPLHGWNPALVRSAADLPQYLILGALDPATFQLSAGGWSARWQGTEHNTWFELAYLAETKRWQIRQAWCGLDGGYCVYTTRMPLDKVITQALYMRFPRNWDTAAKAQLESAYQLTVVEQPGAGYSFCGIPDGAFRTIGFPVAVRNLRPVARGLRDMANEARLGYGLHAEARLVFQALNHVEGKAPAWTSHEAVAFQQSVADTGLAPLGFPVREAADDGSAAWTLRRHVYFLFISLPFAGLTDFLRRAASANGPIRAVADPSLRFELRPIVLPPAFPLQADSLALWDTARSTRSFLQFALPGEADSIPITAENLAAARVAPPTLRDVEAISGEVVTAIEQIFQRAEEGGAP